MITNSKARPVVLKTSFVGLKMADIKGLQSKAWSGPEKGEGRQSSEIREGFPPTPPPTQGKRVPFLRSCKGKNAKWHNLILLISLISLTFLFSCAKLKFDNPYDPKNRPPGPQAFSPEDGAIITNNPPQFSWADCGVDTAYYHLQISTYSLFSNPVFDNNSLHGTTLGISYALPYGQLYWRVRAAKAKEAWGVWSLRYSFFIQSHPTLDIQPGWRQ